MGSCTKHAYRKKSITETQPAQREEGTRSVGLHVMQQPAARTGCTTSISLGPMKLKLIVLETTAPHRARKTTADTKKRVERSMQAGVFYSPWILDRGHPSFHTMWLVFAALAAIAALVSRVSFAAAVNKLRRPIPPPRVLFTLFRPYFWPHDKRDLACVASSWLCLFLGKACSIGGPLSLGNYAESVGEGLRSPRQSLSFLFGDVSLLSGRVHVALVCVFVCVAILQAAVAE